MAASVIVAVASARRLIGMQATAARVGGFGVEGRHGMRDGGCPFAQDGERRQRGSLKGQPREEH